MTARPAQAIVPRATCRVQLLEVSIGARALDGITVAMLKTGGWTLARVPGDFPVAARSGKARAGA